MQYGDEYDDECTQYGDEYDDEWTQYGDEYGDEWGDEWGPGHFGHFRDPENFSPKVDPDRSWTGKIVTFDFQGFP